MKCLTSHLWADGKGWMREEWRRSGWPNYFHSGKLKTWKGIWWHFINYITICAVHTFIPASRWCGRGRGVLSTYLNQGAFCMFTALKLFFFLFSLSFIQYRVILTLVTHQSTFLIDLLVLLQFSSNTLCFPVYDGFYRLCCQQKDMCTKSND